MTNFVLVLIACIFIAFSVFALKEIGCLKATLKIGSICFLLVLITSSIYGLFNDFSFMHGSASAGLDSATAYMFLLGVSIGPVVFFVGGVCGSLIFYFLKKRKQ